MLNISNSLQFCISLQSNYKCPVCQKMFIRKDFYLQHECRGLDGQIIRRSDNMALLQNMQNEQGVICFKCGKTFSSQSALTKHLKVRVLLILHLFANTCQFSKTLWDSVSGEGFFGSYGHYIIYIISQVSTSINLY